MTRHFLTSAKLLILTGLSTTLGYTTTTPTTSASTAAAWKTTSTPKTRRPYSISPDVVDVLPPLVVGGKRSESASIQKLLDGMNTDPTQQQSLPTRTSQTYDLGIGKNKPVVSKYSKTTAFVRNDGIHAHSSLLSKAAFDAPPAVDFLTEYESARPFPSPLLKKEEKEEKIEPAKNQTKRKKVLPVVNPVRRSRDSLRIKAAPRTNRAGSPSIAATSDAQLDVNTVWVEMLLHHEQQKQMQQ